MKSGFIFNNIIQLLNKFGSYGLGMIGIAIIAHSYSKFGLGEFSTANNYINLFAVFADMGLGLLVSRELIKKSHIEQKQFIANAISFRLFLALTSFVLSMFFLIFTNYSSTIKFGALILAFAQFSVFSIQIFTSISQVHLNVLGINISELLSKLTFLLLIILFVLILHYNIEYTFIAVLLGNILFAILGFIFVRKILPITLNFNINIWKEIIRITLPMGLASILGAIYFKIDSVILSFMRSTIEVGMYSLSYKILEVIIILPGLFMGLAFPQMSKLFHEKQDIKLIDLTNKLFEFFLILGLPITIGTIFTAQKLITLVGGDSFGSGIIVSFFGIQIHETSALSLQILAIAAGISFLGSVYAYLLMAIGGQKSAMIRNLYATIFNLILNLLLIPYISFIGAAITTGLTELFILILTLNSVKKRISYKAHFPNLLRICLSVFIMTISVYLMQSINILIEIIIAGLVYGFALLATKVITKDYINQMFPSIK